MKYELGIIRRRSKNNGINLCQYIVIVDSETKEVVYDSNWNINSKYSKPSAEKVLEDFNNQDNLDAYDRYCSEWDLVPKSYRDWINDNVWQPRLKKAFEEELKRKGKKW